MANSTEAKTPPPVVSVIEGLRVRPWPTLPVPVADLGPRVIPVLLLTESGLVKTVRFTKPTYIGDPINAVRIFNEKEVDELILLDIEATPQARGPRFALIQQIAQECFMPLCYGGGVRTLDDIQRLVSLGVEKVAINTAASESPGLVAEAAKRFGSSTLVAALDFKKGLWGRTSVWTRGGRFDTKRELLATARQLEEEGAGEILLTSIDRDGTLKGYDLERVREVSEAVSIPVIACGGAGSVADLLGVLAAHASAAAAGSLFVFHGKHRAVLISYPERQALGRKD